MREDASKAATESVGLLKDGDDIASLRAVTPPLIHLGGHCVRSRPPRPFRLPVGTTLAHRELF
jgi:hypothetical protein